MNTISLFIQKMENFNLPQAAKDTFIYYFRQLLAGTTGLISESELQPVTQNEFLDSKLLSTFFNLGASVLNKTVIIKLNGGLGTTMGLQGPKSLIPVKNDLNFLDITALQIRKINQLHKSSIPLILMNSFKTESESIQALSRYTDLHTDVPLSFLQHMFPRIHAESFTPASCPDNMQLEWNPAGHGNIYLALATSGILDCLLEKGYTYAFVSNIDNLGAELDLNILGYFASSHLSFLMEVTERTWMDRKGGHLARYKDGRLMLREAAQCPQSDSEYFKDISKHQFFNTNNIWVNLSDLKNLLVKNQLHLDLPLIRNCKKLDPVDQNSPDVFQLESAMGTAISIFEKSNAIRVPRTRFAPVKNCEELLLLWSDYFLLNDNFQIIPNPSRSFPQININLDPRFYFRIDQLQSHFTENAPSLVNCNSFTVHGDVKFGKDIIIDGIVSITNKTDSQIFIPDSSRLSGELSFE